MTENRDVHGLIDAVIPLATRALHASQREDWAACKTLIEQISAEHGGDGLSVAMLIWLDTVLTYAMPPGAEGLTRPAWHCADTGEFTTDAHQVRPETAWCGQLAIARANMDRETYDALICAIPEGQAGVYVGELLVTAGLTLNAALVGGGRD